MRTNNNLYIAFERNFKNNRNKLEINKTRKKK